MSQSNQRNYYSTHILMFPFVFSDDVAVVNESLVKNTLWKYEKFDAGASTENYNEYIYFYEYIRKALYSNKPLNVNQTSYYFEYKEQTGKYVLEVNNKKYELEIDGISMRTFNTGVGIFSIELCNTRYHDPKSILMINDFSRRIYPQFLGNERGLDDVKNKLLPQSVTLHLDKEIKEDFTYYSDMNNISSDVTKLPSFIQELLGNDFSSHSQTGKIHIEPIIDDRMFVISMYMNDALANEMKVYQSLEKRYTYEENDFWYKYIFVDAGDKMCQSKHMTKSLIKDTTYDRWVEWGTLFGTSRYSFVALTGSWYGKNMLEPHMRTMYFQIFTLLLVYRASILNFSKSISDLRLGDLTSKELQEKTTNIYKDYINFQNNLFFREVTAQEQGIEIYNQALDVMQIQKHIKDLDGEIAELHTYVSMKAEESRNSRLEKISLLGAVFLPPALIAGIFGMNTLEFIKDSTTMFLSGTALILSAVFGLGMIKSKKRFFKYISGAALFLLITFSLFCLTGTDNNTDDVDKSKLTKGALCQILK